MFKFMLRHRTLSWLSQGIALACLFAVSSAWADGRPSQAQTIEAEPFYIQISRTGRIDFRYITNLSFKTPGYIEKLYADTGQRVVASDTLGTLELTDLKAAQASAKATYEKAVQDVVRARKLYKQKKTVSKDFLEQSETNLIQARSAMNQADYNMERARIEAPFDAVILERLTQPGEQVQAGSPVFSVASLAPDNLVVRLNLTQQEISQVQPYDQTTITLANQTQVTGHVLSVSATAKQATGLYEVEIAINLEENQAFPGQWVQTRIMVSSDQLSYRIPIVALASMMNGKANFVVREQKDYKLRAFEVLHMDQQFIYVPASDGALQVVIRGWDRLLNQLSR